MPPILISIFIATSVVAADNERRKRSDTAEKETKARTEQIQAEIKKLGTHDWAGDYYAGDGTGANRLLRLAPKSGYTFEWHGCVGVYDRNYGAVDSTDHRLRLSFTFINNRDMIEPEFVVVRWGPRRYLVPADDLIGFCNYVNQGFEPRTGKHGFYFLRRGDEKLKVDGEPDLPPDFRNFLLSKPVEASVVAVGPATIKHGRTKLKFRETQLTLDVGKKHGLRVGMELILLHPHIFERVEIRKVEDDRAEAIQFGDNEPTPEMGWRFSTSWKSR